MRRNLTIFCVAAMLAASIQVAYSQRNYKFLTVGTQGESIMSLTDSASFIYTIGRFDSTYFGYEGKVVNGAPAGIGFGNSLFLVKTTPAGRPVWLHSIHGSSDSAFINVEDACINNKGELAIAFYVDYGSSVILDRHTEPLTKMFGNRFVAKFTKNGFPIWIKPIVFEGTFAYGYIKDIKLDEKGNVYVGGDFTADFAKISERTIAGSGNDNQLFLAKYTPQGNVAWASTNQYNLTQDDGHIFLNNMTLNNTGDILLAGNFEGNHDIIFGDDTLFFSGTRDGYLASFDNNGVAKWGKHFRGENNEFVDNVVTDRWDNIAIIGYSNSSNLPIGDKVFQATSSQHDVFIAHYNNEGVFNWMRQIDVQNAEPNSNGAAMNNLFGINRNGDVFYADEFYGNDVLGSENNRGGIGSPDLLFARFDGTDGLTSWTFSAGSSNYEEIDFGDIDVQGNISFSGDYNSDFVIDDIPVDVGPNFSNYFVARILNNGTVDFVNQINGEGSNQIRIKDISTDWFGNVTLAGDFFGNSNWISDIEVSNEFNQGIYIGRYTQVANIQGTVLDIDGFPVVEGYVKAIGYTMRSRSPLIDSIDINPDGTYEFADIPFGIYLLEAFPVNTMEKEYLTGFFPSQGHWENAGHIEVLQSQVYANSNIIVPYYSQPDGDNTIEGIVYEIDSADVFKSTLQKPKTKGRAKLAKSKTKSDWDIVAETETDEFGNFSFTDIENGTYTIFIEIPGIPHETQYEIEVTGGEYISNAEYYIDEEVITAKNPDIPKTTGIITSHKDSERVKIYPNPAVAEIAIKAMEGVLMQQITICDVHGKVVKTYSNIRDEITVSDLAPGVYFASVTTRDGAEVIKFIITK